MRYLIAILMVALALGVIPWPYIAYGTIFFFDAPGAASNPITIIFAISILIYPLPAVVGIIRFFNGWKRADLRACLVNTLVAISGYILVFIMWLLLEVVCDGSFSCG